MRPILLLLLFVAALPAIAQHDLSQVDPAGTDAVAATPLPEKQRRQLKKYETPELSGAKQALGTQLIDGRLPKPVIDYVSTEGVVEQRISIFEGGLVVVKMTGAGNIRKKMILPADALDSYTKLITADALAATDQQTLPVPAERRTSLLRVYSADGEHVQRTFHPGKVLPKPLMDLLVPLRDLLRAVSEDREVTSTLAGYMPQPGDQLVADDQKLYEVVRVVDGAGVVELRCLDAPTTIYVTRKDLHLYFVGRRAE